MTITEFAILRLKDSSLLGMPSFLEPFKQAIDTQAEWAGHPVFVYMDTRDSRTIYLVAGWHDVPSHLEWIGTEENQEALVALKPYLEVKGLVHLDIDFDEIVNQDAKILYCTRGTGDGRYQWQGRDVEGKTEDVFSFGTMAVKPNGEVITMVRFALPWARLRD